MDTNQEAIRSENAHERWRRCNRRPTRSGRAMAGVVVVAVGAVLLARQVGVVLPDWLFTWEMILIAVGIYIGAKHSFRRGGWFVPIVIGVLFLADDVFPDIHIGPVFWPVLIIVAGLFMILFPRKHHRHQWGYGSDAWTGNQGGVDGTTSSDDTISSTSVFGSIKKNIISKNFRGGEITCVFGGAEINLTQADIDGRVVLEITQVFGGTRLIIPPHWDVRSEMVAVLGGIEDKRPVQKEADAGAAKILVIQGTSVMGGIDITSY